MHSYALLVCILMHSFAFACILMPIQLVDPRSTWFCARTRAAPLGGQLVDRLRRDGAVLVAGFSVLLLLKVMHHLDLVHGLASGDDGRVEFIE